MRCTLAPLFGVLLSACSLQLNVPSEAEVKCASDAECPSGFRCKSTVGRCVQLLGDDRPPQLEHSSFNPVVGRGGALHVELDANEPLLTAPTVVLSGATRHALGLELAEGQHYTFGYLQTADDVEGPHPLLATLVDTSGNEAVDLALGTVTFDFTAPALLAVTVDDRALTKGEQVRVTLSLSEPTPRAPDVSFASGEALVAEAGLGGPVFTYVVTGAEIEGPAPLTVRLEDAAGNVTTSTWPAASEGATAGLVFDFTAPVLIDFDRADQRVREAEHVRVAMVASETLAAAPTVLLEPRGAGPTIALALEQQDGDRYVYTHAVVADDLDGDYDVVLTSWRDVAGNAGGRARLHTVTIDQRAPAFISPPAFTQGAGIYNANAHMSFGFTADEPIASARASLQGTACSPGHCDREPSCTASDGVSWVCDYDVAGDEPEAQVAIAIIITDRVGHTVNTALPVVFDFTAPSVLPSLLDLRLQPTTHSNPHASVAAAAADTNVQLTFVTSEPLAAAPTVTAGGFVFTARAGTSTSTFYTYDLAPGIYAATGTYTIVIDMVDLAGNSNSWNAQGDHPEASVTIDAEAPAAPQVWTALTVTYERAPWGLKDQGRSFVVRGAPLSVEGGATVVAYDDANPNAADIGWATAEADGSFVVTLAPPDRPKVFLVAYDAAGNSSRALYGPAQVLDVTWIATFGAKKAGSTLENPHVFEDRASGQELPAQGDAVERGSNDGLAAVDDGAVVSTPGASRWRRAGVPSAISGRHSHAMTYDPLRGRLVLVGGASSPTEVWEADREAWTKSFVFDSEGDGSPTNSQHSPIVFDIAGGATLLLDQAQTWLWNGRSWRNVTPTGFATNPANRTATAMAYDSSQDVVVLFGGAAGAYCDNYNHADYCGGTWEYRAGAAQPDWAQWNPWPPASSPIPPPRANHALAYDRDRQVTVMFGGCVTASSTGPSCDQTLSDTWEFDASASGASQTGTWSNPGPGVGGPPPARGGHAMAYDTARHRTVLFGGCGGALLNYPDLRQCWATGTPLADTWEWDGGGWQQIAIFDPEGDGNPDARLNHTLVYDPLLGGVVLFGGCRTCVSPDPELDDAWLWNGKSWRKLGPTSSAAPKARQSGLLAYDSSRRTVVLFGGTQGGITDTWEWNGLAWTQTVTRPQDLIPPVYAPPYANTPAGRVNHALTFDAARQRTVLFGGDDGYPGTGEQSETWEYGGSVPLWAQQFPAHSPPARLLAALAFDAGHGASVLFGGYGTACTGPELWPSSGIHGCDDTWLYKNGDWTQAPPADPENDGDPAARYGHVMTYDSDRQRIVLMGGEPVATLLQDGVWEWDGTSWAHVTADSYPYARALSGAQQSLAYDESRGATALLFGVPTPQSLPWWWNAGAVPALRWTKGALADPEGDGSPSARTAQGLAFDGARGEMVLFGGWPSGSQPPNEPGDTWILDAGGGSRPAHAARFTFAASNTDPAHCSLRSVEVDWYAGGSGPQGDGATLYVWRQAAFLPVGGLAGSHGAPASTPAKLSASWSAVELAGLGLFRGDERVIEVAVEPTSTNAAMGSTLTTDYVELRVSYHAQ